MKTEALLSKEDIEKAIYRLAHEIVESLPPYSELALIGIRTRGVFLAQRIASMIAGHTGRNPLVGNLDVTLYRDDVKDHKHHSTGETDIPFSIDDKTVVLVDDVLFTGRTIRGALDALLDLGRPNLIALAVLIDRGHRELPIRPDFVGKNITTDKKDRVRVMLSESDPQDAVVVSRS